MAHRVTCPHCHRSFAAPPTMQSRGGNARAASLTPERKREIARLAARARWKNHRPDGS